MAEGVAGDARFGSGSGVRGLRYLVEPEGEYGPPVGTSNAPSPNYTDEDGLIGTVTDEGGIVVIGERMSALDKVWYDLSHVSDGATRVLSSYGEAQIAEASLYDLRPALSAYARWGAAPVTRPALRNDLLMDPLVADGAGLDQLLGGEGIRKFDYRTPVTRHEVLMTGVEVGGLAASSIKALTGIRGATRGTPEIIWIDENAGLKGLAKSYNDSAIGARSNVLTKSGQAPALERTMPDGTIRVVKFDGVDGNVMIDRKLSIVTTDKAKSQALRQSDVLRQHGLTGQWEVPTQAQHTRASKMLNNLNISNIVVRVVKP